LLENFDPQAVELIKGIAAGVSISFEEALMVRVLMELMFFYSGQVPGLCTSFAATGKAVISGETFLGQNFDLFDGIPFVLLRIKRAEGMEQLCLVYGGIFECGLNSAGIGIGFTASSPHRNSGHKLNIPIGCYLPKLLRQQTISDALGVLCQAARSMLYYNLGSSGVDIVGFESTFDDLNVMQPKRDMLVHSNHYMTERFKKGDWYGQSNPDSYIRVQRIKRLMELNYGQLTPKLMMDILADHNNYPNSICRHVDETKPLPQGSTQASVIMIPAEGTMFVACGNPCQYEFVEYKLESIF